MSNQESAPSLGSWFELLFQDISYGARMLRKSPGLSLVIVISLAIGIGANTAIFSVTNALLLKPLSFPDPDRLAILWLRSPGIGIDQDWPSPGQFNDIKTQSSSFEELALAIGRSANLTGLNQPERVQVVQCTYSLLHMLGAKASLGRSFLPDEDVPGKPSTALLAYGTWARLYGSDPNVVGRSLVLNGNSYTIVGVLEPKFKLDREVMATVGGLDTAEIFTSMPLTAALLQRRGDENYNIMARVKPGVTMRQAQADVDVIAARIRKDDQRDATFTISVVPLLEQVVGNVRQTILVLLGAVALVLLIACANVANLLLVRTSSRQKEIAIRASLGASWTRIIRQLLTESVLLGILGGVAGLAIAAAALYLVRVINPGNIPRLDDIAIDGRVLTFTLSISILTGIIFGIGPALRIANVDLNSALKQGGRNSGGSGLAIKNDVLRSLLVIAEVALSLMLLVGAGLLIRSFIRIQSVPPGFNTDHMISMRVSLAGPKYNGQPKATAQFYDQFSEKLRNLPGVKGQGEVTALPLTPSVGWGGLEVEGYVPPPNAPEIQGDQRIVSPDYFQTMEIPLKKGSFFSESDTMDSPPVIIVDEKMANQFWPNGDAVGKRVRFGGPDSKWYIVIGVVGTVKQYGLDADTRIVSYFSSKEAPSNTMYVVARTSIEPSSVANSMVSLIHSIEPDAPVYDVSTMDRRLTNSLARKQFSTLMLGAFAIFALILASIGVYAVLSYMVTQSTRDIGIRIALGAQQGGILKLVIGQGMTLAVIGEVLGLVGALLLSRVMSSLLYGTSVTDMVTFTGVSALLIAVALFACYVPARRAMRINPMLALRFE
ncbi:MAG TPA: ABC transporter permease [Blastocatellia bacterium]|nr:ABC transporter permease [Blastocatellia bacterium]